MRRRLWSAVDDAAVGVMFLTRIPVPWRVDDVERRLSRATPWFPLIGTLVGGAGALAWWVGSALGGPWLGAFAAVAATMWLTGAFHEDGLADTFDGLGAERDREQALAIMRDSRLGTYGAAALFMSLAGRIVALAALDSLAPLALLGAHTLARLSALPLIRWLVYAREDGGLGKPFAGGVSGAGLLAATLFSALVTFLVWEAAAVIAAWLAFALATLLMGYWFRHRLGGITGDTLGAANQAVELAVYLGLLAVLH